MFRTKGNEAFKQIIRYYQEIKVLGFQIKKSSHLPDRLDIISSLTKVKTFPIDKTSKFGF